MSQVSQPQHSLVNCLIAIFGLWKVDIIGPPDFVDWSYRLTAVCLLLPLSVCHLVCVCGVFYFLKLPKDLPNLLHYGREQ